MVKNNGHYFNFTGGDILSRIGAGWFISFWYHNLIDKKHRNWELNYTEKSITSRKSKFNNSKQHHVFWLKQILDMKDENLVRHSNLNLSAKEIKQMAKTILEKNINKTQTSTKG